MKQNSRNAVLPPRVITDHEEVWLEWDRRKSHLTVPLDKQSNVANIHHAPGHQQHKPFLQQAQLEGEVNDKDPVTLEAMSSNVVSDSESDDEQSEAFNHPDNKDWNTG